MDPKQIKARMAALNSVIDGAAPDEDLSVSGNEEAAPAVPSIHDWVKQQLGKPAKYRAPENKLTPKIRS